MRAVVFNVLYPSNVTGSPIALNNIGLVNGTGVTCTNFTLDGENNHFISNLTIAYSSSSIT